MSRLLANAAALMAFCPYLLLAQEPPARNAPVPIYRVTVVEHGIDAVNYQYRSAPTKIDFRGTVLMPDAKGEATVESRRPITWESWCRIRGITARSGSPRICRRSP
jgi:hypothetical protein